MRSRKAGIPFPKRARKWELCPQSTFYTSTLSISTVTLSDIGTYSCIATYTHSDGSNPVVLSGTVVVTVRGFETHPADQTADQGSDVVMSCVVVGDQRASISWTQDSEDLSGDEDVYDEPNKKTTSTLTIRSAVADNTGVYKCRADFGGTVVESDTATLTVIDIGIIGDPTNAAYLVGEDAVLSCTIRNPASSTLTVTWYRAVGQTDTPLDLTLFNFDYSNPATSTLTFSSATMDKSGVYKCEADYVISGQTFTKTSGTANLYIRELSKTLNEYTAANSLGGSQRFTCEYHGDDNVEGVTWVYNEGALPAGYSVTQGSYGGNTEKWETVLTVDPILKSSGGAIKCAFSFSGTGQDITSTTTFRVRSVDPLDAEVLSSLESYTVTCTYKGNDEPSVLWVVAGSIVSESDEGISINTGSVNHDTNERNDQLIVSGRIYSDASKPITCKYMFTDPAAELTAYTVLKFRGLTSGLNSKYYSSGAAVIMQCGLGVGSEGADLGEDLPAGADLPSSEGAAPRSTFWYNIDVDANDPLVTGSTYKVTTDTEVNNGLFKTTLTIKEEGITTTNAGVYMCMFSVSDSESYASKGRLIVGLVRTLPSEDRVYSYANAGLQLSCILDASDEVSAITWSGPDGKIDPSQYSSDQDDPNTHILTLTSRASSGEYRCSFVLSEGNVPEGIFPDVNLNLVEMFHADLTVPEVSWLNGDIATQETPEALVVAEDSSTIQSKLPITISLENDNSVYKCVITYSGLATHAGNSLENSTTVIMNKIVTSSLDAPVQVFAGDSTTLFCLATAAPGVDIKWRKKAADYTGQNQNYITLIAEQEDYDIQTGTRKSILTLSSLMGTDASDSIECYDDTVGISEVITLEVIEVVAKDSEVLKDTAATISCVVNGLTKQLDAVTWEKPSSGGVITHGTAAEDYQIAVGTYDSGSNSQTTVLTIPASANGADAAITPVDMSATTAVDQTLVCNIGDVTTAVTVSWTSGDNTQITDGQGGYTITQGTVSSNIQESSLTITAATLQAQDYKFSSVIWKCAAKSSQYADSEQSEYQDLTVTFLTLEVVAKDSEVLKDTAATISCVVNGLTKQLDAVTWEKPSSGGVITHGTAAEDYQIAVGTYDSGSNSQTTVLTIPASANGADAGYTCVIQCDEHGKTSGGSEEKTNVNSNVFTITPVDMSATTAVDQTLVCNIGDVTTAVTVSWTSGDNTQITDDSEKSEYQDLTVTFLTLEVVAKDSEVLKDTAATISCVVNGLTKQLDAVTWEKPSSGGVITHGTAAEDYQIALSLLLTCQQPPLWIRHWSAISETCYATRIDYNFSSVIWKCAAKSSQYPDSEKSEYQDLTVTFLTLEVVAKDSEVLKDTAATISCVVNGLTKQLDAVTWEKPSSGGVITHGTAAEDYQIAVGTYDSGSKSQTTVLTIPASANGADAGYTCVIQCDEHGKTSGGSEEKTNVNSNVFTITPVDMSATTAVDQTLVCNIGDVTTAVTVSWTSGDNTQITDGQGGYTITQGTVSSNIQESSLTITAATLQAQETSSAP
ncbi:basement membrane-specific heparan sulfate proteoglycan core protein-like [Bolinopsis microptera]|uniref:basement membrane-specific heparan sulfate proteoglycan core protein-like n=1 Tax=Bolinopsis microptera TaxID=2820187 RepID=UPI003079BB4F